MYFDCGYDGYDHTVYCRQVFCTVQNHGAVTVGGNDSFPSCTL